MEQNKIAQGRCTKGIAVKTEEKHDVFNKSVIKHWSIVQTPVLSLRDDYMKAALWYFGGTVNDIHISHSCFVYSPTQDAYSGGVKKISMHFFRLKVVVLFKDYRYLWD